MMQGQARGRYFGGMRIHFSLLASLVVPLMSSAQVLFEHPYRFDGPCHADQLVRLADGDLMIAGVKGSSLFIARATIGGDTLWTYDLDHAAMRVNAMELVNDSTLLLACGELIAVKTDGTGLQVIGMADDVSVQAPDTFVTVVNNLVTARTLEGDELWNWTSPGTIPTDCRVDRILAMPDGGAIALGARHYDNGMYINTVPWMAHVDNTGHLTDSLTLRHVQYVATTVGWELVRTADGGYLGAIWESTVNNLVVRGTSQGDTLWTTHQGYYQPWPNGYFDTPHTIVERPSGNIDLVGEGSAPGFTASLLELSASGAPLCLFLRPRDTLPNVDDYMFDRDLFTDAIVTENDEVIALASYAYPYYGGQVVDSTYWALVGFGDPCLPLEVRSPAGARFAVHPQPCTTDLFFEQNDGEGVRHAELFDMFGRRVQEIRSASNVQRMDVSALPSGAYLLCLWDQNAVPAMFHVEVAR